MDFGRSKADVTDIKDILDSMNDKIIMDELTGIYNKRYINERLPVDMNSSKINECPLSLIITDIDFFKQVNDVYGHVIGDKVLKYFSNIISSSIRSTTDWVGRYGGDEFLIVLNNTNAENAYKVAEKIRNILKQSIFEAGDIKINITASFGGYEVVDKILNLEDPIKRADKNLYLAKNSGRNRIVI
jgi:two-component system, cell cycle response regulator